MSRKKFVTLSLLFACIWGLMPTCATRSHLSKNSSTPENTDEPKTKLEKHSSEINALTYFRGEGVNLSTYLADLNKEPEVYKNAEEFLNSRSMDILLKIAKKQIENNPKFENLHETEIAALRMYTSGFHFSLNIALRNPDDPQSLNKFEAISKVLASAINKKDDLSFRGKVYRYIGADDKLLKSFVKGGIYTDKGFMSCTTQRGLLSRPVELIIEATRAKYIASFSEIRTEEEVIISAGNSFEILDVEKDETLTRVYLKQL